MLNIPRKVEVYRDAIIPDPGYDLVDADYDAQELIIVAVIAQEKSWLEYMEKGYDIHSKNSELIFGEEWFDAVMDACCYYEVDPATGTPKYKKCSCPGHEEMRDNSKAVSFGKLKCVYLHQTKGVMNEKLMEILLKSTSAKDFADKSGLPYWKAYELAKKHCPSLTNKVYKTTTRIKELILKGKTVNNISRSLNVSTQHVRNQFHKLKIPLKGEGSGGQNAKVKHNPFNGSLEAQYWVGFILADGHVSKHKYNISLCQKYSDRDILLKFDDFLGVILHKVVKKYTTQSGEVKIIWYSSLGNKEIHSYFKSIGFTSNKGKTMDLKIPLTWSIVSGWFDGDGHVSVDKKVLKITTGSFSMVEKLRIFLNHWHIDSYVCTKGTAFDVLIRPKSKLLFAKNINHLNIPRLSRKYKALASLIEILSKQESVNSEKVLEEG